MIEDKEAREKLLALEEGKREEPVVIDATKGDSEEPAETLESVTPPEDPGAFNPGGSRR